MAYVALGARGLLPWGSILAKQANVPISLRLNYFQEEKWKCYQSGSCPTSKNVVSWGNDANSE